MAEEADHHRRGSPRIDRPVEGRPYDEVRGRVDLRERCERMGTLPRSSPLSREQLEGDVPPRDHPLPVVQAGF